MDLVNLVIIIACVSLFYALFLFVKVKSQSAGNERMQEISSKIREGAIVYLKRQYKSVSIFFGTIFLIMIALSFCGIIGKFMPYSFLLGGLLSGISGYIGMRMATMANVRTTEAARKSLVKALDISFSAGSIIGFVVVGVGLSGIGICYYLLKQHLIHMDTAYNIESILGEVITNLLTFGMGVSAMSLFARVGGGIFTKAADVGADLVGKIEMGIPEDDPKNPAVIADNVGDNVGDVAGMGADLFESYVNSIISCSALALGSGFGESGVILPFLLAAVGIVASIIGSFFVKTREDAGQPQLLFTLRKGIYLSNILMCVFSFFLIKNIFPNNLNLFFSIFFGQICGMAIGYCTEYFTSSAYRPTKELSRSTKTGAGTVVISGLSLGMLSAFLPVIIVSACILISFFSSGGRIVTDFQIFSKGLYGISLAAVGMLSTLGITVATDAYGPIADNAGGIAEMSGLTEEVRKRTDMLDSLGNTTAATGKGFAIGSAGLTSLALVAAYINQAKMINPSQIFDLSIINPCVLIGLFVGASLPFLFSAFTMSSVGKAAMDVVCEVRRQFKEIKGLMEGKADPDYQSCVDICTKASVRQMLVPALIGVVSPLAMSLFLGVSGVSGMLVGATVSGAVLALTMSNAGGAWDNSKKYIESGHFGGKKSENHKAAVVGDTVGDPFKDTSGPAINILIKLLAMVSIVFVSIAVSGSLF
ncbi:MAG: sodium-translocating pyrophosphatase [Candidatus Improbicoccus pseudotrichonymphae]|uniref:Putative K(+)-stimulated pyrophosphate-energized sodium pump n=1 Tax=Candidatus Improbicoccus pseudotrichonymphae TaxID=3033792 RepID=A0AA48I0Q5_9FIRM|nr:MAG: sodium-translocating pyrophosphatase [Candidatus Improbicoccus pseudotrichonymphae]